MSFTVHQSDHPELPARRKGKMPTHKQMIVSKTCRDAAKLNYGSSQNLLIANGVGRCAKREALK